MAEMVYLPYCVGVVDEKCFQCLAFKIKEAPNGEYACENVAICLRAITLREKEGKAI